jgi:hypothetical protein
MCRDRGRCGGKPRRAAPKKQRQYDSGQQKRYTQKAQVVAHKTRDIICVAVGKGREHDCTLFTRSQRPSKDEIECLTDRGYQGLQKLPSHRQPPRRNLNEES